MSPVPPAPQVPRPPPAPPHQGPAAPSAGQPGDPLRGVSVHYLTTKFLRDIEAAGLTREAKIYEIESRLVRAKGALDCPRDGKPGCAYVDQLEGEDSAGRATHFLSYTWGSTAADMADALGSWCQRRGLDPKRTYVWVCCLCINRHRVHEAKGGDAGNNFAEFAISLRSLLRGIGSVLALMQPWRAPRYVTRTWCLYELFTAVQLGADCQVEVIMPSRDATSFDEALRGRGSADLGKFWSGLAATRVQDADASVASDREQILSAIDGVPGIVRFNRVVVRQLQGLFAGVAESHAARQAENSCTGPVAAGELVGACRRAADMLVPLAKHNRAAALLQGARATLEKSGQRETVAYAELLESIGRVAAARGDASGALESYETALQVHEELGTLETTEEGAELLSQVGLAKVQRSDTTGALESFQHARAVREATGTLETPNGAALLGNLGDAKGHHQDFEGALESYKVARRIREVTGTLLTADGATLLASIGQAKSQRSDFEGALLSYEDALQIRENTGTLETPEGATLLTNLGIARHQRGDAEGAHQNYEAARQIRERLGMLTPSPPTDAGPNAELESSAPSVGSASLCHQM